MATVAASSAIPDNERLLQGLAVLENWGLVCLRSDVVGQHWGYLAGTDADRRSDLLRSETAAYCLCQGGWERLPAGVGSSLAARLALGFSDVTALLWSRLAAGYGGGIHDLCSRPWQQNRIGARNVCVNSCSANPSVTSTESGSAEGCQPVLWWLPISPWQPISWDPATFPVNGALLILEDVGEAPYRIDRMLTHWRLCGALKGLAGIGFGQFQDSVTRTVRRTGVSALIRC